MSELVIDTPRWALPLLTPARYKGAYGGRSASKSHFFAECVVEEMIADPDCKVVCIREIQKSLEFSAYSLIKKKIQKLEVSHLFDITKREFRRIGGEGVCIFQGMQDHTADTIKSLEGFHIAWVEEAQSISAKSLKLLRPTIRTDREDRNAELWFSWNPDQPEDAIDQFLRGEKPPSNSIVVKVNYTENPFLPESVKEEIKEDRTRMTPEDFAHVWLGEYNLKSDAIIFSGNWRVDEFKPDKYWDGPYQGLDFGFANDPTAATRSWIYNDTLYIEYEAGSVHLELDDTADFICRKIPEFEKYTTRADNARPESISYLNRKGLPNIEAVEKWKGSVEDGIEHMKSYKDIVVHPRCKMVQQEFRLYSYKVDKRSGDVLPKIEDANNHYIDSERYALSPMIKAKSRAGVLF